MSVIKIINLTFGYDASAVNVFENLSLELDSDWRLGLVGRNGRGKTTLMKLLAGELAEYSGKIKASVEFEYFPPVVPDETKPTLEALRDIRGAKDWRLQRELTLLGVREDAMERPFCTLSPGERTKALLAALFSRENAFLLIDEPTNHLDEPAREAVAEYMRSKRGFILVSHDRAFLDACVDHILALNRNSVEVQSGNFSQWYYNKQLRDEFELEQNEKLRREIRRLENAARRTKEWADRAEASKIGLDSRQREKKSGGWRAYAGEKSRKLQKKRKNLERRQAEAIEQKSSLLRDVEEREELSLSPLRHHTDRLVELRNVSIDYGSGEICSDISFFIKRGDRIALRGSNGTGKSSIIKLVLGEKIPHTGEVFTASGLKVSYVPQDASSLSGSLDDYADRYGANRTMLRTILRKLDFPREAFLRDISTYSSGQKKKVALARSLCESAHLYVWDEPLNFIDLMSRIMIEELITEYRPTLLFVEHDRAFRENVATKTVELGWIAMPDRDELDRLIRPQPDET
ncbi:MAG: ribosomal protection-like ABC-F family protein [Eubacteriales bacterium]|jgi:lincosamide and streptogramin A transport system ATP-binding/permease protein